MNLQVKEMPSPGAPPPCPPCAHWPASSLNPTLWGSLCRFPHTGPFLVPPSSLEMGWKFQAIYHGLVFLVTSPLPGAPPRVTSVHKRKDVPLTQKITRVLGMLFQELGAETTMHISSMSQCAQLKPSTQTRWLTFPSDWKISLDFFVLPAPPHPPPPTMLTSTPPG